MINELAFPVKTSLIYEILYSGPHCVRTQIKIEETVMFRLTTTVKKKQQLNYLNWPIDRFFFFLLEKP